MPSYAHLLLHRRSFLLLPILFFLLCFIDAVQGYLVEPKVVAGKISSLVTCEETASSKKPKLTLFLDEHPSQSFSTSCGLIEPSKRTPKIGDHTMIHYTAGFLGTKSKRGAEILKLEVEQRKVFDVIALAKEISFNLMLVYGILSLLLILWFSALLRRELSGS